MFSKKSFPIYINTLNIFRPWRTWFYNVFIRGKYYSTPVMKFETFKSSFTDLESKLYTWYWWEHVHRWDFKNKKVLVIIDDVFTKYKFSIHELEQVPFILIRIGQRNFIMKLKAPKWIDANFYWESMKPYPED